MDQTNRGKLGIIACESGKQFAESVTKDLELIIQKEEGHDEVKIRKSKEVIFANTEPKTELEESIRIQDAYIVQDVANRSKGLSVNDNYMILKTAIDAVRLADAHYITVVVPTFPYARQDKQKKREGITAAFVARELAALGVKRVLTLDVHNETIAGFFPPSTILENLHASKNLLDYIRANINLENLVVTAPDAGAGTKNEYYANKLLTQLNFLHKKRNYDDPNEVTKVVLVGDVGGKDVLMVDDMIDTASTFSKSIEALKKGGARNIYFACSLAFFNGDALKTIDRLYKNEMITKVICTDAVFKPEGFKEKHPWYEEVSVAKYFARVIYNINRGISISRLLE
jgi:ribose-phosphate pyrophosphokinase